MCVVLAVAVGILARGNVTVMLSASTWAPPAWPSALRTSQTDACLVCLANLEAARGKRFTPSGRGRVGHSARTVS